MSAISNRLGRQRRQAKRTRRFLINKFGGGGFKGGSGGSGGGGFRPPGAGGGGPGAPRFDRDRGPRRDQRKDGLRVNREIRAPEVRVIDDEGQMLGVMAPHEALRLAEDRGLDLIEIAPTAKPPTCKIMDYGKYKYEAKKKEHQARKNQTTIVIKEVQLRPRTDKHDIETKLKNARRFLIEGDKVKVTVRFSGREMAHQEQGLQVIRKVEAALADLAIVETSPRTEGRQMFALFAPDAAKIKDAQKKTPDEDELCAMVEAKIQIPIPTAPMRPSAPAPAPSAPPPAAAPVEETAEAKEEV